MNPNRLYTVNDIIAVIDRFAPPALAMDGDVIGLQIGNPNRRVERMMIALDAYPEVIHQAVTSGVDLLITHHAPLYRPLRRIDTSSARGKAIAVALAHDLAIYTAHTNLDVAEGGVNDVLANLLNLQDVKILDRQTNEQLRKLVVFVPAYAHELVLQAVCSQGAGHIGAYSHCTFNTPGVGTFLPHKGSHPAIGMVGRLERTEEVRLETIVPVSNLSTIVRAMLEAHPYEEVAYDVYPLDIMGRAFGIGRVGNLSDKMPLAQFAETVKNRLGLSHIRFGGLPTSMVQRVAVLGGSGGKWARQALDLGADVLVTSDADHHTVAEALQDGLAIIDATHASMERPVLNALAHFLDEQTNGEIHIEVANVNEDPFVWL